MSFQVVRKKLSPDEISPPGTRYNAGSNKVQATPDNGVTWNDAPGLDPRSNPALLLPPVSSSDPRCDAAAGMVAQMKSVVQTFVHAANLTQAATLIFAGVALILPGLGIIADAVLLLASALFTVGQIEVEAAMTDETYETLLCIFYCQTDPDGQVSEAGFARIYDAITAQLSDPAAGISARILDLIGRVGLNNAGASSTESGDCSECECEWCYEWDTAGLNAGNDWTHATNETYSQVYVAAPSGAYSIFYAEMHYDWNGVDGGDGSAAVIRADGVNLAAQIPLLGGDGNLLYDDVSIIPNEWVLAGNAAHTGDGGTFVITFFKIKGRGAKPTFTDGLEC